MCRRLAVIAITLIVASRSSVAVAEVCIGCRALDVSFTPDVFTPPINVVNQRPQIVVWLETAAGEYIEAMPDGAPLFITQQTGTFGIGNRPGRSDFNSGPLWPYGRRDMVFPVWSHRRAAAFGTFPRVVFQTGSENDLSHPMSKSSAELHFCRPLRDNGADKTFWDTGTCASQSFTDKGFLSSTETSLYPPRADVSRGTEDSLDLDMFGVLNTFDAVSQATPAPGQDTVVTWPIPQDFPSGEYVVWIEISKEFDFNTSYNDARFPSPLVTYGDYGEAFRGQPSVLYKVPIMITQSGTLAETAEYAGYSDPDGLDGNVRAPDATITSNVPGSGSSRLALQVDHLGMYRVRAEVRFERDCIAPGAASFMQYEGTQGRVTTFSFVAPGDDDLEGTVRGYEMRFRAVGDLTEENFETGDKVATSVVPEPSGAIQTVEMDTLLPSTRYTVAIRAFDNCHNLGPITRLEFTTPDRKSGEVDACFVATAAYGSVMANDVSLLRHFRDSVMRNSALGELVVESYYTFGPAVAGVIGESDLLRETVRGVLGPIIGWVKTFD